MLVVGDKEASGEVLTVRRRGSQDQASMSKAEFIASILDEVKGRR
jgi:threonyl-tRNA synthetase